MITGNTPDLEPAGSQPIPTLVRFMRREERLHTRPKKSETPNISPRAVFLHRPVLRVCDLTVLLGEPKQIGQYLDRLSIVLLIRELKRRSNFGCEACPGTPNFHLHQS
jgi:hypothetical protein